MPKLTKYFTCTIDGCNEEHVAFGMCSKHYQRFKNHGDHISYCTQGGCKNPRHKMTKCLSHFTEWELLNKSLKKRCLKCGNVKMFSDFNKSNRAGSANNLQPWCKECASISRKENYYENIERERDKRLRLNYKIDSVEYNRMLEKQSGKCAVCGLGEREIGGWGKKIPLAVHHQKSTGKVIALCCAKCNRGMGMFGDKPELLKKAAQLNEEGTWVES